MHNTTGDNKVWGVAYRIIASRVAEVQKYLDIREVGGYSIHYTAFHPAASSSYKGPIHTMVYIGTPDNPQFVGPQDPQTLAERIWRSRGPSGENKEYLLELADSLEVLSPESGDDHVRDLVARVRGIERREIGGGADGAVSGIGNGISGLLRIAKTRGGAESGEQEDALADALEGKKARSGVVPTRRDMSETGKDESNSKKSTMTEPYD